MFIIIIIIIIIIILISSEIKRIQRLFRFICLSLIIWLLQSVGHAVDDEWRYYFFFYDKQANWLFNQRIYQNYNSKTYIKIWWNKNNHK